MMDLGTLRNVVKGKWNLSGYRHGHQMIEGSIRLEVAVLKAADTQQ